jgi:hypothetical protein
MSESRLEAQILKKFESALERAIERHEELQVSDMDDIARQKLLVNAVREFDLDHLVTTAWFKDGDVLTELDNYQTKADITNAGVDNGPIPDEGEIISYFLDEEQENSLSAVLDVEDRKEWLDAYYRERDDTPFEEIYYDGMKIHLHIRAVSRFCLSSEDRPEDIVSPVVESSNDLKRNMRRVPLFRNIPPYVTEFTRVAETILSEFENRLKSDQPDMDAWAGVFDQLNRFYFETVWDVIANRIAFYTAEGPNESRSRNFREGSLKVSKQSFGIEFDKLRNVCRRVGIEITADVDRLPDLEKEFGSTADFLEMRENGSVEG